MSHATCNHDATTDAVNESNLARYMEEGADLLELADFGFASRDNRPPEPDGHQRPEG